MVHSLKLDLLILGQKLNYRSHDFNFWTQIFQNTFCFYFRWFCPFIELIKHFTVQIRLLLREKLFNAHRLHCHQGLRPRFFKIRLPFLLVHNLEDVLIGQKANFFLCFLNCHICNSIDCMVHGWIELNFQFFFLFLVEITRFYFLMHQLVLYLSFVLERWVLMTEILI